MSLFGIGPAPKNKHSLPPNIINPGTDKFLDAGSFITLPTGWTIDSIKTETKKCEYCGSENNTKSNCESCGAHP